MSILGIDEIPLDPLVHTRVLLPLCALLFSFAVVKQYIFLWSAHETQSPIDEKEITETLRRAHFLLSAENIDEEFFHSEYRDLIDSKNGRLSKLVQTNSLENLFDTRFMQSTMTRNIVSFLPNIAMVQFIDHFFSGVFVFRLPFALPSCLRPLIQRGVEIDTIPTSYVTALSFYFVVLFAQAPLVDLLVGKAAHGDTPLNFHQVSASSHQDVSQESCKGLVDELRKRKEQYMKV